MYASTCCVLLLPQHLVLFGTGAALVEWVISCVW
jgi:hypothetical protein